MELTIAIPTLDRKDYLQETVRSLLEQSFSDFEIVLSDNASRDGTPDVVRSFCDPRIRSFRQEHRLPMATHWNACLAQARGRLFLLLSDDDLLLPGALEEMVRPFQDPSVSMAISPFITIDGEGGEIGVAPYRPGRMSGATFIQTHLSRKVFVMPSGVVARTASVRSCGGFPEIGTTSDLGLRLSLAALGDVVCLPHPFVHYRVHATNLSGRTVAVVDSHMALLAWCGERPELGPYMDDIKAYILRGVTGAGFRSALAGGWEESGLAVIQALKGLGLPTWQEGLHKLICRAGQRGSVRLFMNARDRILLAINKGLRKERGHGG